MSEAEVQLYMDRAWQDLKAAQSNLGQVFYEVAISRAYYAMFYAANALLAHKGVLRKTHSGVISAFGQHFVKTGLIESEYAKMLGQSFDSRLDNDYDIAFHPDRKLAAKIVRDAEQFLDRVERYLRQVDGE